MGFKLVCSECKGKFKWEGEWPQFCPLCRADMALPDDDVIPMPMIGKASTKATDKVYRDMEAGSEMRAQLAAEAAGTTVAEMSGLKITNLNDRKDAEIAAVEDKSALARLAPRVATGTEFFKGSGGAEFAAGVSTGDVTVNGITTHGIAPRAGITAHSQIKKALGVV